MKRIYKIFVFIVILLFVCGCDKKQSLNKDEISKKLTSKGFIVSDVTDKMEDNNVTVVLVANNSGYSVEYYKFKDEKKAIESFENNKELFEAYEKNGKEKSKDNYNVYTQERENKYNKLVRVDNTLIYASVSEEYKSNLNKVLKDIGY